MRADEAALIRLWREKRGESEPEDLSNNLIVQLGVATEELNRNWYERNSQCSVTDVQRWVPHPVHRYLPATLDGFVNALDAVCEAGNGRCAQSSSPPRRAAWERRSLMRGGTLS